MYTTMMWDEYILCQYWSCKISFCFFKICFCTFVIYPLLKSFEAIIKQKISSQCVHKEMWYCRSKFQKCQNSVGYKTQKLIFFIQYCHIYRQLRSRPFYMENFKVIEGEGHEIQNFKFSKDSNGHKINLSSKIKILFQTFFR